MTQPAFDESIEELYEMAPCGYLTTTVEGRIVKVNRTFAEWLGYGQDELTGKTFAGLLTVGGRMFYETHFDLLLRMQDAVNEIALDFVCRNGDVLPSLVNARQKRDATGEPVLNRFTVFNSTERRMYERQLLAARDLLHATLSGIGDGVIATDCDGRITFMNPVAEDLSGWKSDDAAGKPIDEVLVLTRENTSTRVENPVTRAIREGVIVGLANRTVLVSRDGRQIPIDDSSSPMRGSGGEMLGGVLVFRDISTRRKAEQALRDAHAKLELQAAELRRSNEDLSQFAQVASHDLRSPLNTVINFAQLLELQHGQQLGEGMKLLSFVTGAAKRMRTLIDDLLTYATASEDGTDQPGPVDANVQFRAAIENLQAPIQDSGATITHDALPNVFICGTSLTQVLQNLIGNAIHYRSADAPRIHVSVTDQGDHWLFACRDNGIGIAPEYQTQIFTAFKRLHGSDRPGSGIGLAVCKRIVERYKGKIWVQSQPEQGSTFFFTLPKAV